MKRISVISLALSFSAIVMVDAEKTSLGVVALLLVWFAVSAAFAKRHLMKELRNIQ